MNTYSAHEPRESGTRPIHLYYPEYGPVEAVLGYAVFYYVVDFLTAPLTARLTALVPEFTATGVTTALAVALWAILALTVLGQVVRQTADNPRTFDSVADRDAFLARHRPSRAAETVRLVALTVGAGTLALVWGSIPGALERLVLAVGPVEAIAAIPVETVAVVALAAVGVTLVNYALDRLLVGGLRAFAADVQ